MPPFAQPVHETPPHGWDIKGNEYQSQRDHPETEHGQETEEAPYHEEEADNGPYARRKPPPCDDGALAQQSIQSLSPVAGINHLKMFQ